MPILVVDPWRKQYFAAVPCPDEVRIPVDDGDAWLLFPEQRWVYDKLKIAESQGFECGPHGIDPPSFPVFSKPVFNMRGMGTGSRVMRSLREYRAHQRPGHIWMPLLEGEHVSTDAAVVRGEPCWWRHSTGLAADEGMFDYWTVWADARPEIEEPCAAWLRRHLAGYTGMVNFETIGTRIIEVHLRFADQWPDLYGGAPWVEALVRLYRDGVWAFDDSARRDGYSFALFGEHGHRYRHPPEAAVGEVLAMPGVTSVQITFHEDRPPSWHAMPPGGFRLAIVNATEPEAARAARERLRPHYEATREKIGRRR